ncbi:alkaline phosphatase PafA [Imtechella halotolerans]|uniref:Type I phosphodiesterase/nucleotide pyrophosphatase n=1 Tax=Imtechella halotolerans K1 TaxID=946077 RepID=I0WE09_9FLAO|nr:alkaline phosphatase PafA [Imtechella halotolerans]EID74625.1 type I phosphodiesterase/nucleotide pyrophosphatase [Imtechella halotolerans K1]WMQ62473.1 alkaline phosphatase family protein [Imtechella halotolerans]
MKNILSFLIAFICSLTAVGQTSAPYESPKLVVGIVVDQMRYDYITRYWERYREDGFKRMIREGFNARNHHFNYVPTYTGPGHTSVYTGTTPAVHGIIGNDWYDKTIDKSVYCAGDDNVTPVGTQDAAGKMSPHRMKTTTVTDQLKLATQSRSKVIGIALKDRGAILPAGHTADAAYWFHGKNEGAWITSSYYMEELPKWVKDFNKAKSVSKYKKEWNTLYDIHTYVASGSDDNTFEGKFKGENAPVFPHNLPNLWKDNGSYDILKATPFGNSITTDFALAALEGEQLGQGKTTDFLAISYSSPDYIGHSFGVNSIEVEDCYLRLDLELARLFSALDSRVGKGNYTVFLTADHGAVHVPAYLKSLNIPAGYFEKNEFVGRLKNFLKNKFNSDKLIKNVSNNQLFLDYDELAAINQSAKEVQEAIAEEILNYDGIAEVYTAHSMKTQHYTEGMAYMLQKGFNHKRSGDVLVVLDASFISYSRTGSTHGSGFNYDTQVPFLMFGNGIKQGSTTRRTEIPDIAPTVAALLGIAYPNGTTGNPVGEALIEK